MNIAPRPFLSLDFESRSTLDLRLTSTHVYAAHKDTFLWCCAFSVNGGDAFLWEEGDPVPQCVIDAVQYNWEIRAWNAQFERLMWTFCAAPKYGWPVPKLEQFRCTAVEASAMGLPRGLDDASRALNLTEKKDMAGHRLMMQMAKPRKWDPLTWWNDDARRKKLGAYCLQDVRTEVAAAKKLRRISAAELAAYHMDQRINDRGTFVDRPLVIAMKECVTAYCAQAQLRASEITGGYVTAASQLEKIKELVRPHIPDIGGITKDTLPALLDDDRLPAHLKELLQIRADTSKTSTAKLDKMLSGTSADGRLRGMYVFYGAHTGRWTSELVQTHNLVRGKPENEGAIKWFLQRDLTAIAEFYGSVPSVVSALLRGCFIASPGNTLVVADFSNIEGRLTAWYGGEEKALHAYRQYDAGLGPDTYKVEYANAFGGTTEDVDDDKRATGKVLSLACGFSGGVGALVRMARGGMSQLETIATLVKTKVSAEDWAYAESFYDEEKETLPKEIWTGLKAAVNRWRQSNSNIVLFWREAMDSALNAVRQPGTVFSAANGKVRFKCSHGVLWVQLPSGRLISYFAPSLQKQPTPWSTEEKPDIRTVVTFWGLKKIGNGRPVWLKQTLQKTVLIENIVQATAADIQKDAMTRLEAAKFSVAMHTHDEIICDEKPSFGILERMQSIMTQDPGWAAGLPLATKGWVGPRYRKD